MMQSVLSVKGLKKSFMINGAPVKVLDDFAMEIMPGTRMALLGKNGSGKSTALKCILDVVRRDEGDVQWYDTKPGEISAILEGSDGLHERLSPIENALYFCALKRVNPDRGYLRSLMHDLDIVAYKDIEARKLSTGNKRKAALLASLLSRPKLMILDEPTLGLDYGAKIELTKLISKVVKEHNIGLIMTSHDLEMILDLTDEAVILEKGRTIQSASTQGLGINGLRVALAGRVSS